MSWQMPTQGQWPPAVAMTPDMMNVGGSYTPEQWAVMQQNWQQWAQWQQQYAQWQNQYGEKYAQQMQAMQANSAPPRPPNSAPPPAPPPPDQPPPPPHENNQPLYASAPPAAQSAPVPPPNSARTPRSNLTTVNITQGNAQSQRSHEEPKESQPAVNTEALRKLAEEEKLFDIQFQKWEEEIDKWRKENVNHPDKEAYKEYEAKFEACRAQLLERRQQMNQKRARLLSSAPTPPAGNKPPAVPPPPIKTASPYDQSQSQGYNNRQDYHNQSQSFNKKQDQSYSNPNASYQQFSEPPPTHNQQYNRANRGNIDPQDRYESYEDADNYPADDYPPDNSSFLPTSGAFKNIPGLDLVPDTDKPPPPINQQDVIDITEEHPAKKQPPKGPDYTTISKGINNILGDEKIMNILSSLQGSQDTSNKNKNQNNAQNNYNNQNMPNNQWNRNDNYNQQYGNRQNNMPFNNRQDQNYPMQQNVPMQPNNLMHQHQNHPMQQNNSMNQNHPMQQNNSMNQNYPMQHNNSMNQNRPMAQNNSMDQNRSMQPNNPLIQNHPMHQNHPMQHNQNQNRYPPNQRNMYEEGQGDSYDRNSQYGGQDMPQRNDQGQRQNTSAPRPLLDLPVQAPPMNHFQRRPPNIGMAQNVPSNAPPPPPRPKWMDEPLFTPSFIVEYEHKPLRLKARDFIEPVHMFEYHHKSKDGDTIKKDFEKEVDELFSRKPKRDRENEYPVDRVDNSDRYNRDPYSRDFERRVPRDDNRDDYRRPPREDFEERRRPDDRYDDRRRDDRDKYTRRDDKDRDRDRERERERDRDFHRDRYSRDNYGRESRRDETRHRSRSRERDSRKREHSRETDSGSKKSKESAGDNDKPKHVVMIDDILESPGREMRPDKIVVILRGPPGSGKSYLAKLIRDREAEYGGTARIMSIDDYFMQEGEIEEKDPTTGKTVKKPTLKYEYDEKQEETYLNSLKRAFKRSLTDGYFTFLIYDAVNEHLRTYADVWNFARQNGFQVYVCTMELDPQICYKRNIHNRKLEDIEVICSCFFATPSHHIQLDPTTLLQSAAIPDVHMEDAEDVVIMEDAQEPEVESVFTSKWERMDDAAQLAKLDGTSKPLRPSQFSMEDYLQLDDWTPNKAKPGKKTVRWADIEERRQQEKMRAIGFVVGQTDWNRMTDPTMGSSALTQTKYIERVRRT